MDALTPRIAKYSRPVNILFVGAGAVGCFYASRLHSPESNVFVSIVCRSNYEAIMRNGGRVKMQTRNFGDYVFSPSAVYPSIRAAAEAGRAAAIDSNVSPTGRRQQGWDYIFVTTKALPDVTDDARDIDPLVRLAPDGRTCIVLIQNGVGIEEPHRRRFPLNPVVTAVTIVNAEQTAPGVVRQNRWTRISMGPYSDGVGGKSASARTLAERGTAATRQLVTLFAEPGKLRDAEEHDEIGILLVRWHKICINAAMNPSAVLSGGLPSADMVLDTELRTHLRGVMEEVFDAAPVILGRAFPPNLASPERILRSTERNTGGRPSMLVDWQTGRPLELEVILGNPIRIARRHGVDMQRLQSMYAFLKSAQKVRDSVWSDRGGDGAAAPAAASETTGPTTRVIGLGNVSAGPVLPLSGGVRGERKSVRKLAEPKVVVAAAADQDQDQDSDWPEESDGGEAGPVLPPIARPRKKSSRKAVTVTPPASKKAESVAKQKQKPAKGSPRVSRAGKPASDRAAARVEPVQAVPPEPEPEPVLEAEPAEAEESATEEEEEAGDRGGEEPAPLHYSAIDKLEAQLKEARRQGKDIFKAHRSAVSPAGGERRRAAVGEKARGPAGGRAEVSDGKEVEKVEQEEKEKVDDRHRLPAGLEEEEIRSLAGDGESGAGALEEVPREDVETDAGDASDAEADEEKAVDSQDRSALSESSASAAAVADEQDRETVHGDMSDAEEGEQTVAAEVPVRVHGKAESPDGEVADPLAVEEDESDNEDSANDEAFSEPAHAVEAADDLEEALALREAEADAEAEPADYVQTVRDERAGVEEEKERKLRPLDDGEILVAEARPGEDGSGREPGPEPGPVWAAAGGWRDETPRRLRARL